MVKKLHVSLVLGFLVLLFVLFRLKTQPLQTGFNVAVKKLESFINWIWCRELYQFFLLNCGTMLMNRRESLILLRNTYGRLLLWFVGYARRNGIDNIITRRVLICVVGLMAFAVIKIQSIIGLIFLSFLFVFLVFLVAIMYDSDTSGYTEGVCICFLASAGVYASQGVLYHALVCFCVSGIALTAKRIRG